MSQRRPPFYTLREFAEMTGETLTAVRKRADRGTLRTKMHAGRRVIWHSDLEEMFPELVASLRRIKYAQNLGKPSR